MRRVRETKRNWYEFFRAGPGTRWGIVGVSVDNKWKSEGLRLTTCMYAGHFWPLLSLRGSISDRANSRSLSQNLFPYYVVYSIPSHKECERSFSFVQNMERVIQNLMTDVTELQRQLHSSTQQLMEKEAELTRAEETIRREQQQNQEMRQQVRHQMSGDNIRADWICIGAVQQEED